MSTTPIAEPSESDARYPQRAREPKGFWERFVHRITTDADELDAEELGDQAEKSGSCRCCDLSTGEEVFVSGRLRSVLYTPSDHAPALTAELFDGSGSLRLVWLGQRRIPGIEPGRSITIRGRVAKRGGEWAVFNPWYELKPL